MSHTSSNNNLMTPRGGTYHSYYLLVQITEIMCLIAPKLRVAAMLWLLIDSKTAQTLLYKAVPLMMPSSLKLRILVSSYRSCSLISRE